MIAFCTNTGYTTKRLNILVYELNNLEIILKNTLQYYHYFMRPNFAQKPDVDIAVEKYKLFADDNTIAELRELVGKNHSIDFESLGSKKLSLKGDAVDEENPDETTDLSSNYKEVEDQSIYSDEGNDGKI